ncbi:MAG: SDR family oxidoreductase [Vicingaceae bacterium]
MNIVVSGASKGIGFELALQLAKLGHRVLAIARSEDRLAMLKEQSKLIEVLAIDLMDRALSSEIAKKVPGWKQVDVVINNAGQLINMPFIQSTLEDFEQQYKGNVLTSINLIQACHPYYRKGTHIVNITSMGGVQGSSKFPGLSAYSASKGALVVLSECLAAEYKELGVLINALALGAVQTEMLDEAFPGYEAPLTAKEMAKYIAEFACNGGNYYNGQVLPVALGNP